MSDPASILTAAFLLAIIIYVAIQYWLARRQIRYVAAHRGEVPARFADRVSLAAHQKAADYTVARTRLGMVDTWVGVVVLLGLNANFYVLLLRRRGIRQAAAGVPLHVLHHGVSVVAVPVAIAKHLLARRR